MPGSARSWMRPPPESVVSRSVHRLALALIAALYASPVFANAAKAGAANTPETVHVPAGQIARKAPGTSIITREDITRRPAADDLSDVLRMMPGVNLTGNGACCACRNNRRIDPRGMGPENAPILIDARRVSARDSVRMDVAGGRNSCGDANWVLAEAVARIGGLPGPAAARCGSGAAGGVVNNLGDERIAREDSKASTAGVPTYNAPGWA